MRMRGRRLLPIVLSLLIIILLCVSYISNHLRNNNGDEYIIHLPANDGSGTEQAVTPTSSVHHPGPLLNLTDFNYLLASNVCSHVAKESKELLAVLIVTSYAGNDALRAAHRQAIAQSKLTEMGLRRVFLLAALPPHEVFITQKQLIDEQARFGDLLQGNFLENYHNLSYKHVMGLRWAATECRHRAKFIIKLDDDIIYDIFHLRRYLEMLEVAEPELAVSGTLLDGFAIDARPPIRNQASKWYVTRQEYSDALYPAYLSGWLYITNAATAERLVAEAARSPIFWIDDIWLTGVVRTRLGIRLRRHNEWYSANAEFLDCCVRDLKQTSYECEFYVGPNGGDTKLLVEFLHNVEKCYFDECSKRPEGKSLRKTCIGAAKALVPEHGIPVVEPIKLR